MQKKDKKITLNCRIKQSQKEKIDRIAKKRQLSKGEVVRRAIDALEE